MYELYGINYDGQIIFTFPSSFPFVTFLRKDFGEQLLHTGLECLREAAIIRREVWNDLIAIEISLQAR